MKSKKYIVKILIILIFTILAIQIIETLIEKLIYKTDYSEFVNKYAEQYGVEKELIFSIIKVESNFNCNAKSVSNAKGLMQLMYSTAKEVAKQNDIELTEENISEPEINIELGTIYIANLLKEYNSMEIALAAYNAGKGNVDKWINQGVIKNDGSDIENVPFKETNMYVRKVLRDYKIYQKIL